MMVDVHSEFASDDAPLKMDALDAVTHDVNLNDDLLIVLLYDVDFLLFDDHFNGDDALGVLLLSSAY